MAGSATPAARTLCVPPKPKMVRPTPCDMPSRNSPSYRSPFASPEPGPHMYTCTFGCERAPSRNRRANADSKSAR